MFAAGSFSIDRERAPEAIRELQFALDELQDIKKDAMRLGHVNPMSRDSVSIDAARAFEAVATGGPGSLTSALDAAIEQVQELITTMRAEIGNYEIAQDEVRSSFDSGHRA